MFLGDAASDNMTNVWIGRQDVFGCHLSQAVNGISL